MKISDKDPDILIKIWVNVGKRKFNYRVNTEVKKILPKLPSVTDEALSKAKNILANELLKIIGSILIKEI